MQYTFELKLTNGQLFTIQTDREAIDTLIDLIGDAHIDYCEELWKEHMFFPEVIYQSIMDADETWFIWAKGNALLICDCQLLDAWYE